MAKSPRTKPTAPRAPKAGAAKKPKADAPAATPAGPDEHAIARRAYEIYQERGGAHGSDVEDWLQAEREIRPRRPGAS